MKKNILFFINLLCCGGAERALINAVKLLPRDKYDITVVAIAGGNFEHELPDYVKFRPVLKTDNHFFQLVFFYFLYHFPLKSLFCKLFLRGDYDEVVAFLEGLPTNVISKYKKPAKKIAFVHFGFDENHLPRLGYKTKSDFISTYEQFDEVCFVSKSTKQSFETITGERNNHFIVHNFIDNEFVISNSQEKSENVFDTSGVKIVTVGRLVEFKGHSRLIDIAKKLEEKYDFQIVVIGDGDQYDALSEKIKKIGCRSVKLLGYRENPYTYMKQADLYISTSLNSEGYNTAVCEALILGLPVLTTDSHGMKEILGDGKYGLITGLDDESLQDGFIKMLSDNSFLKYKDNIDELDKAVFVKNAIKEYSEVL